LERKEGRKEEAMSRFGNGSRDLTPNVFTIAKEYLLF